MRNLEITDKQIRTLATNRAVFQAGISYFQAGRVSRIVFDPAKLTFNATVIGTYPYQVEIELTRNGIVQAYRCTCPAISRYVGACKHVVAVVKAVQAELPAYLKRTGLPDRGAEELLAFLENRRLEEASEELNLEIELQLLTGNRITTHLALKAGLERLYVVKDIGEFLKSMKTGRPLEFGKQFTFEPHRQEFKDEDRPLINLLQDMYEEHLAWLGFDHLYMSYNSSFAKKLLPLSGIYLKKVLDALGDRAFLLRMDSLSLIHTQVNRQALPLEFSLQAEEENLSLELKSNKLPVQLTVDGSYFIYEGEIYQATDEQQEMLPTIISAFRKGVNHTLTLPAPKKEFFVSEALPAIEKIGKVIIDQDLQDKLRRENLLTKIYFERGANNGIAARVEFHYGEAVINPFAPSGKSHSDHKPLLDKRILIRDMEEERNVLNILEQAEFNVIMGTIHLLDERKIFEFATHYLPQLQNLAEIYYSEDFKFTIRTTVSFSGRVRLDESLDLLEISFNYTDIDEAELTDIFRAINLKKRYFRLQDGSFLDLKQPEFENVAQLIDQLDLKAEDLGQQVLQLPKYRAMYIDNYLRQAKLPGIQRNKAFKQLVQSILEPHDGEFEIPAGLEKVLRDYQKTGFKWLKILASYGLGGILADDMGLGKTLQVLAFILSEKHTLSAKQISTNPALVIAPTSLVYNWQEEAKKFAPELRVLVVEGTPQVREAQLQTVEQWDLVVTSYPLLRRDIDRYAEREFSYCFLDEAQHIKNPQTFNAKSVQQLKAKGYFALTGTPIENSLSELWSIFNFVMPGYLLSHPEFRQKYEIPIIKGEDPAPLNELSRHVTPFILRRLKKDVLLELPEKIETRLKAQMTDEQAKIYLAFLQEAKKSIATEIAAVGFQRSQIKILAAFTRLRQICCHPGSFIEGYQGESGKMNLFQEVLLDALDSGHRVLVFSQFTSVLSLIETFLGREKIKYFYLNGSTKAQDRMQMAQAFNGGEGEVFLISLKAGGTGLNLTGADMVIHFDPWWNPAVEEQATDRAYRIGQKNAVQVIKLVTQGTIEEKVQALQEKKKKLIEAVIQPGETLLSKLTEEELRELFE